VEQPVLRVDGLVAQPLNLTVDDLAPLQRCDLDETFSCDDGRAASGQRWRGFRVADIVALSQPLPDARFVRVSSGGFVIPIAIEEAGSALLTDTLNGQPLALERGAPWRLVVPGGRCFTSVKWVNHLELTAEAGRDTGELIERARLSRDARTMT
jgi:DMSO/TMAO reductase YedYZ molybdopterin-dependent catalytic subunit